MLDFVVKFLESKTTTFSRARQEGEIVQEIEVYPSKDILVCGEGIYEYEGKDMLRNLIQELGGGAIH